jgi:hypothetical protein
MKVDSKLHVPSGTGIVGTQSEGSLALRQVTIFPVAMFVGCDCVLYMYFNFIVDSSNTDTYFNFLDEASVSQDEFVF